MENTETEKRGAVLLSFGTSVEEARVRDMAPVEAALRACTGVPCLTAYTSPTIRKILQARGENVPDLAGALEALLRAGVEEALVQPTHLLYGFEYDSIKKALEERRGLFKQVRLGVPLLSGTEDLRAMARVLGGLWPREEGAAAVFLGHGTEHWANMAYPALQTALGLLGREDLLIGTVEGWPGYEEVSRELSRRGVKKVRLSPLMLTAGDHARNDMAGAGEHSWRSRLEKEGYKVECRLEGLGALPPVQEMYAGHFRALLSEDGDGL